MQKNLHVRCRRIVLSRNWSSVTELRMEDIAWNEIGSEGAVAIATALQHNNVLTSLVLGTM